MASCSQSSTVTGLSLCAGYAGLDLGLEIAIPGYRTVCYVEREAHAAATLVARMADQALAEAPVWDDLKTFNGRAWRGKVHIVSAGYPCQPFSVSGQRRGKRDPRHVWPDVARIIGEVRPNAIVLENVEGHIDLGFAEVARELQELGYQAKAGLFTAREVGARHRRRRLIVLAYANGQRYWEHWRPAVRSGADQREVTLRSQGREREASAASVRDQIVDNRVVVDSSDGALDRDALPIFAPGPAELSQWGRILSIDPSLQPALLRDEHELADRLDRTRGVGNGVVSLQAAYAFRTLSSAFARR
ncbi:MAG: DNA cytosine methyltransferase [Pseudomonadota bacterium]